MKRLIAFVLVAVASGAAFAFDNIVYLPQPLPGETTHVCMGVVEPEALPILAKSAKLSKERAYRIGGMLEAKGWIHMLNANEPVIIHGSVTIFNKKFICITAEGYSTPMMVDPKAVREMEKKRSTHDQKMLDALMGAAEKGDLEMVKSLIAEGANINGKDDIGETALMQAVLAHPPHLDVVNLLIEKGADLHAKNKNGEVLMYAVADERQCPELVKLLLDRGGNVNARDADGDTPLMRAVNGFRINISLEVVKLLLARGADVNARNNEGRTALVKACLGVKHPTRTEVLKLLIGKGADINAKDKAGFTGLRVAVEGGGGDKELIKWLETHGAR